MARSSLAGYASGWLIAGAVLVGQVVLGERADAWAASSFLLGPFWNNGPAPGLLAVFFFVAFGLYTTLFGRLFLVSWLARRVGPWIGGALATLVTALLFFPPVTVLPIEWSVPLWVLIVGRGGGALPALRPAHRLPRIGDRPARARRRRHSSSRTRRGSSSRAGSACSPAPFRWP